MDNNRFQKRLHLDRLRELLERFLAIFGVSKDITELKLSEEKFNKVFHASPSIVGLSDLETGEFYEVNRTFCEVLGFKQSEVIHRKSTDLLKMDPVFRKEVIQKLKDQGYVRNEEGIIYTSDATPLNVLLSAEIIELQDRKYNFTTAIDITDYRSTQEKLRLSEERFRFLAENMADIIWTLDMDLKTTYVSPSIEKVLGFTPEERKQQPLEEMMTQESLQRTSVLLTEQLRLEEIPGADKDRSITAEIEYYHADGHTVWMESNLKAMRNKEGEMIGIYGASRDITERKRAQELMIQTEKMMSVGGLAAGMAHELNNPLGGMLQGIQNIQRRLSPGLKANQKLATETGIDLKKLQSYLEQRGILTHLSGIRESGQKAAGIISNMLQFSRKSASDMVTTDLAALMEDALELAGKDYDLKKRYDFRNIQIVKEFDPDMPPVPCVKTEIEQVVLNLLRNTAARFSIDVS